MIQWTPFQATPRILPQGISGPRKLRPMDDVWHTDLEQDPPDPISGPQGVSSWILVLLGVSYYCISFRNSSSIIILY